MLAQVSLLTYKDCNGTHIEDFYESVRNSSLTFDIQFVPPNHVKRWDVRFLHCREFGAVLVPHVFRFKSLHELQLHQRKSPGFMAGRKCTLTPESSVIHFLGHEGEKYMTPWEVWKLNNMFKWMNRTEMLQISGMGSTNARQCEGSKLIALVVQETHIQPLSATRNSWTLG